MKRNRSMQKTYFIKSRNFKEIADGKGYLEYSLVDENGEQRIVSAMAEQGRFTEFKKIKPVYRREQPLVRALAKASLNDTVYIDFTKFNFKNPRPGKTSKNDRNVRVTRSTPNYTGCAGGYSELQYILTDKIKLLKLVMFGGIGFLGLVLLKAAA